MDQPITITASPPPPIPIGTWHLCLISPCDLSQSSKVVFLKQNLQPLHLVNTKELRKTIVLFFSGIEDINTAVEVQGCVNTLSLIVETISTLQLGEDSGPSCTQSSLA